MRIAILQFNPTLGALEANMERANALLKTAGPIDLLVLPEMAFSGYNFPDLAAVRPYLEPTAAGPSTRWAMDTAARLSCHVMVGYPEVSTAADGTTRNYNALATVGPTGHVLHNYRKSFLYYTDETWASEGFDSARRNPWPFFCDALGDLGRVGLGICMDINPYRFQAPWHVYEFAHRMLYGQARLVVLSMAWLTRLLPEELLVEPDKPDMETVAYWLERFHPLLEQKLDEEIIVVFANRCGAEGNQTNTVHVENGEEVEAGDRVCYAGSSCVMRFQGGSAKMFEKRPNEVAVLGKGEEDLLVVDTQKPARFLLQQKGA